MKHVVVEALFCWMLLSGCSYINEKLGFKDDNFIEEASEKVIESKLGMPPGSIDLTPASKEKRG
jgi:hypothetical protein